MEAPGHNRAVTRFVLGFVALSLVASLLPLITLDRVSGVVPLLDRSSSLVTYASFLLGFFLLMFPANFPRDGTRRIAPWWVLALFVLMFATIPLVVAAWISGVSAGGLVAIGCILASAGGAAMLAHAAFGATAHVVCAMVGVTLGLVIPAVEVLTASLGLTSPVSLAVASPTAWIHRIACLREVPSITGFAIAAVVPWLLVPLIARRRRGRGPKLVSAAILLVLVPGGLLPQASDADVTITPRLSSARAGARVPLEVTVPRGAGHATLRFRSDFHDVEPGEHRVIFATLTHGESDFEVTSGGRTRRVPLGVTLVDDRSTLVGVTEAVGLRALPPAGDSSSLVVLAGDLLRFPGGAAGLESLDALVVRQPEWDAATGASTVRAFAALGGHCVVVGRAAGDEPFGQGWIHGAADPASALRDAARFRRREAASFDATLKSLFASPDWQALDLSRLILFLFLYHVAFVLAFLLPLRLDAHKSQAVYLVSVGFVVVVVVLAARGVLRSFFLRDNQVYSQACTVVTLGAGDAPAVARQFRCYASMSGETWSTPWPAHRNLLAYRDPGFPPGRFMTADAGASLEDVRLDRFHAKLLVREDLVDAAPLRLEAEGSGGFLVRTREGVDDVLGIRHATFRRAILIDGGGAHACRVDGARISLDPAAPAPAFGALPRALIGAFAGPLPQGAGTPGRRLLVEAEGARRLDSPAGLFQLNDLGSFLVFEIPE